ncbi:MAG: DinB family protein [Gemmatimonadota bacterium]
MAERVQLVEEMLDAWRYAREGFIEEAANIPVEDWGSRPTPESRTVPELIRHVVEASLMAVGEITRPDGDFARQGYPAHVEEHAGTLPGHPDRAEWLALLRQTLETGIQRLRSAGPDLLLEPIRQFNGEPATRLTWFHHHIAHEEYHRGQLALYARLSGHVPALTRRIRGD